MSTLKKSESEGLDCFLKIDHPLGMELRCEEGQAWITQEGDSRDYILRTGGVMRFTREGRVLVSGLGSCACAVRNADGHPVLFSVERRGPQAPAGSATRFLKK